MLEYEEWKETFDTGGIDMQETTINRRYRIVEFLNEGGMTEVYHARDMQEDNRAVALKFVPVDKLSTRRIHLLRNEYRLLTRLSHPNLEEVYRFGYVHEGPEDLRDTFFFSSELLKGQNLLEASRALGPVEICEYVIPLCRALQFVHTNYLVHHDVKPQNIVVSSDFRASAGGASDRGDRSGHLPAFLKLVDFDLSESLDTDENLEHRGTSAYIAPELVRGEPADERADLYSLGVTLFHLLSGNLLYAQNEFPVDPETRRDQIHQKLREDIPAVPDRLPDLIYRLLSPDPDERPDSARSVLNELNRVIGTGYPCETPQTIQGYIESTLFIGRQDELERVADLRQQIDSGEEDFHIVIATGRKGIGKSRLAEEFASLAMTENDSVFEHALQPGSSERNQVRHFVSRVNSLLNLDDSDGQQNQDDAEVGLQDKTVETLLENVSVNVDPEENWESVTSEIANWVRSRFPLQKDHTMNLIIKDLEHATPEMLSFLQQFLSTLKSSCDESSGVLVLLTCCRGMANRQTRNVLDSIGGWEFVTEIELEPLDEREEEEFIRSMFEDASDQLIRDLCELKTEGNPVVIERRMKELVQMGILFATEQGWMLDRPEFKRYRERTDSFVEKEKQVDGKHEGSKEERISKEASVHSGPGTSRDSSRAASNEEEVNQADPSEQKKRAASGAEQESEGQEDSAGRTRYGRILGGSKAMQELYRTLDYVIPTELNIVIEGETGTGKELVAREIHEKGPRSEGPFVAVNCARFSESLLESELFGYVKGSFTGAEKDRKGLIEQADGGTLFLDEISEMSMDMQGKLLRVMETERVRRIGAEEVTEVNVRYLCATNRPLKEGMNAGSFRDDLYYRLRDASVYVPPLENRREDIPMLVDHFLSELAGDEKQKKKRVDQETLLFLMNRSWPGNVRQLRSKVRQMAIFSGDRRNIHPSDMQDSSNLGQDVPTTKIGVSSSDTPTPVQNVRPEDVRPLEEIEKREIEKALQATDGKKQEAAELLGIHRSTLYRKIKEYSL